jgi:hypothetical protein
MAMSSGSENPTGNPTITERVVTVLENIDETLQAINATLERIEAQRAGQPDASAQDGARDDTAGTESNAETEGMMKDSLPDDDSPELSQHEALPALKGLLKELGVNTEKVEFANIPSKDGVVFEDDWKEMSDDEQDTFRDVTMDTEWIEVNTWGETPNGNNVPDDYIVVYADLPAAKTEVYG